MRQPDSAWSFRRAGDTIVIGGLWIAELAVLAMFVIITAEIATRGVLGLSLLVVNEFAGYLLVVMTFFGAAYSLRSGGLLRIQFILFSLPRRLRASLEALFDAMALLLLAVLLWQLLVFTMSTWNRGMVAPTLSGIRLWIPQLMMPLGAFLLVIGLVLELRDNLARALGYDVPRPSFHHDTETRI